MNAAELIKHWIRIAENGEISRAEAQKAFFPFIACWVAFNAYYTRQYNKSGDHQGVVAAGADTQLQRLHERLLPSDPTYQSSVAFFRVPVQDMKFPSNSRKVQNDGAWDQVIECIYLVRNNLIHGNKSSDDDRDVACAANALVILSRMMKGIEAAGLL